ncbi:MAG: DUF3291 domain-containing protein [Acidimicrobiia bacterium]|nr:DUF3291 domain-containing protein [Acidimicrobiia bacterium]
MPFVSVTRLRLRLVRYLIPFLAHTVLSSLQARRSTGNLGLKLLRDANRTFWTLSIWQREEDMRSFMMSGAHRRAMPKLLNWCDEASVAHWSQESSRLPAWDQAHRNLVERGRPSKVRFPSSSHREFQIPKPHF